MKGNKFCAFLRGVNVKGTTMKMVDVCKVFSDAGMVNVSSILATGNIIFESEKNNSELKNLLEKSMSDYFNYNCFMFVKTREEVNSIFENNPFESSPDFHIYSFIGSDDIVQILQEEFQNSKKSIGEDAQKIANNFYWKVPKGNTLDSEFGKILGRKNLKDKFTSRNINTIQKIVNKF